MFTKEQIYLQETYFISKSIVDMDTLKDSLCELVNKIIDELNIQSLTRINVKGLSFTDIEAGVARHSIVEGKFESQIDLSYKTFVNVYWGRNSKNFELHKKSVAVVWHEMYHVHDFENQYKNLHIMKLSSQITAKSKQCYITGAELWSEFYANYNTFQYYEDTEKYQSLIDTYQIISEKYMLSQNEDMPFQYFKNFIYYLCSVLGYEANNNHSPLADNALSHIEHQNLINKTRKMLQNILSIYPDHINWFAFVELGEHLWNIIASFGFQVHYIEGRPFTTIKTNIY